MSYKDVRFLTTANLRTSPESENPATVEVDNVEFTFIPIEREFNYIDLKREKETLGYQLNVEADFRWISASLPIQGFIQSKTLEIEFPLIGTGWMGVYSSVTPSAKYQRQIQRKEYNIVFKIKDPFTTLPAWSEPVKTTLSIEGNN